MTNETSEAAVGSLASALATLPDDIRGIVVEQALRAAMAGSETETFEPGGAKDIGAAPMEKRMEDLTSTDRSRVLVFSMQDGEPHEILRIDRRRVLQLNLEDGSPAFWAPGMPSRPPARVKGTLHCYLHPDSPDRAVVDALGFAGRYCNDGDRTKNSKADFRNSVDRDSHTRRKHSGFWGVWTVSKAEKIQQDTLDVQRETLKAMQAIATQANRNDPNRPIFECPECDYVGQTEHALDVHVGLSHKAGGRVRPAKVAATVAPEPESPVMPVTQDDIDALTV